MNIWAETGMRFDARTSVTGTPPSGAGRKPGALQLSRPGACGLPAAPRGPQGTSGMPPPNPAGAEELCVLGLWLPGLRVLTTDLWVLSLHNPGGVSRKTQVASPRQLLIPSPSYFVMRSGSPPSALSSLSALTRGRQPLCPGQCRADETGCLECRREGSTPKRRLHVWRE